MPRGHKATKGDQTCPFCCREPSATKCEDPNCCTCFPCEDARCHCNGWRANEPPNKKDGNDLRVCKHLEILDKTNTEATRCGTNNKDKNMARCLLCGEESNLPVRRGHWSTCKGEAHTAQAREKARDLEKTKAVRKRKAAGAAGEGVPAGESSRKRCRAVIEGTSARTNARSAGAAGEGVPVGRSSRKRPRETVGEATSEHINAHSCGVAIMANQISVLVDNEPKDLQSVVDHMLMLLSGGTPIITVPEGDFLQFVNNCNDFVGDLGYWFERGEIEGKVPAGFEPGSIVELREGRLFQPSAERPEMLVVVSDHNIKYKGGRIPEDEQTGHWCAWIGVVQMRVQGDDLCHNAWIGAGPNGETVVVERGSSRAVGRVVSLPAEGTYNALVAVHFAMGSMGSNGDWAALCEETANRLREETGRLDQFEQRLKNLEHTQTDYQVMVSYGRGDADPRADAVHAAVRACGYSCFVDRAEITPGQPWKEELGNALDTCKVFVALLDAKFASSDHEYGCLAELRRAQERCIPVLPLLLGSYQLPEELAALKGLQYIRWHDDDVTVLDKLTSVLKDKYKLKRQGELPVSRVLPAESGEDRIAFEGRDELVARCLQFVDVSNTGLACVLICLWGPGGYGKTTAARHIMEDQSITKLYGGGVLRVNLRGTDPEHALNQHAVAVELLGQVSNEKPAPGEVLRSLQRLFDGTSARRCLILFDDALDMDQIWHVAKELRGVLCVVTSRTKLKHNLPKSHPAIVEELDRFTQETVRRVFDCHIASAEDDFLWSNEPSASDKELLLNELAAQCTGIPYEAGMVAARLCHALGGTQDYRSAVQQQIDSLAPEQRVRTLQEPQGEWSIGRALNPTLALLGPSQRAALDAMSMFPGSFTLSDLELLKIDHTPWRIVKLLLKLCLLHRGDRDGDFVLHDLTRSFISSQLSDPAQTQRTYCEGCILLSADLVSNSASDPASVLRRAKDAARNLVHAVQLAQHLLDAGLCQRVLEAVWMLGRFPRTQWACAGVLDSLVVLVDRQEQESEIQHHSNKAKLAGMLYALGREAESEPMFREVLEWRHTNLGAEHKDTVSAKASLAGTLYSLGREAESVPMCREVLEWRLANLGAEHMDSLRAKANLAGTLYSLGREAESEPMQREVLKWRLANLGAEHMDSLRAKASLAATLFSLGREAESEPMFREVLEWLHTNLGAEHMETVSAKADLATTLSSLRREAESEPMQREVLEWRLANLGAEHMDSLRAKADLAGTLYSLGREAESEPMQREVLEWRLANLGAEHMDTVRAKANLAATLFRLGREAESEPMCREVLEWRHTNLGAEHIDTVSAKASLAATLNRLQGM